MVNILKIKKSLSNLLLDRLFYITAAPIEGGCGNYKSIKISSVESRFLGCA